MDKDVIKQVVLEQESTKRLESTGIERERLALIESLIPLSHAIETGLVKQIAFHFSKKQGRYLENIVYLELRRRYKELFYYKTEDNLEVDFLVREGTKITLLVQVTESLKDPKTREREYRALIK